MEKENISENKIEKPRIVSKSGNFMNTIFVYYKKYWQMAIFILIFVVLIVCCAIAIPLLTYEMTTDISISNLKKSPYSSISVDVFESKLSIPYWGIHWQTLLYIGLGIVCFDMIALYMSQFLQIKLGKKIEIHLRNIALESLIKQDISYYSDKKIGEIITKIISDTQIIGEQSSQVPVQLITALLQVSAGVTMMFIFDVKMTAIALSFFVIMLVVLFSSMKAVRRRIVKVRTVITEANGVVTDKINTVRLIKSSGTEIYETQKIKEEHENYYRVNKKLAKIQAFMIVIIFGGLTILQFITIGAAMVIHGNSSDSAMFFQTTFAAYTLAQGVMTSPLFQVIMATVGITTATVAGRRVSEVISSKPIFNFHYNDGVIIDEIFGDIILKDVEFRYPEKPDQLILPKFNFTFEEGKSYAFVGETGSGKSTIAKILLRFYDPYSGDVLIQNGNVNLKDVQLSSYLNSVGYVEQDPQIMFGNVYDNVRYGRFDASNDEVEEACKKAELHELIKTWKDGYNTILGERGMLLSGGQKQRLVIARMFLKDPKLLILDEATSALDNVVEKEIQAKLEDLMKGRTTISIAHRLSTIKNCDKIIVLAPGIGIVQVGKFNELKKQPGHFKNLYEAGIS
ncbi:ABC transporter ATP-binding protein [Spiroplasma endosymbiont of Aspidapion aeneum]|uniref:ABC transporter ATP-binding protein n=1 Tax=Spiroplasma endosymbiont of Aspidapion aeneum TaxID=3066276 RepID=UPI00313E1038